MEQTPLHVRCATETVTGADTAATTLPRAPRTSTCPPSNALPTRSASSTLLVPESPGADFQRDLPASVSRRTRSRRWDVSWRMSIHCCLPLTVRRAADRSLVRCVRPQRTPHCHPRTQPRQALHRPRECCCLEPPSGRWGRPHRRTASQTRASSRPVHLASTRRPLRPHDASTGAQARPSASSAPHESASPAPRRRVSTP